MKVLSLAAVCAVGVGVAIQLYGWATALHGRCVECGRTHQRLYEYLEVRLCLDCFNAALNWHVPSRQSSGN